MTITELKNYLYGELSSIGIEESEVLAELEVLLSTLTGLRQAQRLIDPLRSVEDETFERAREIVARRKKREPLQYCLGETYFYGMRFLVRAGVLIPRADTETLVESAVKYFKAIAAQSLDKPDEYLRLAEIGTGSGIISISMLKELPAALIEACDLSAEAVNLSLENAKLHNLAARFEVTRADWKDWLPSLKLPIDGLLSNPPYIPLQEKEGLAPELKLWEPDLALFGGDDDGLSFYRELADQPGSMFSARARVFLEIGAGQANSVSDIFCRRNWRVAGLEKDLNGIARVLSLIPPNSPF